MKRKLTALILSTLLLAACGNSQSNEAKEVDPKVQTESSETMEKNSDTLDEDQDDPKDAQDDEQKGDEEKKQDEKNNKDEQQEEEENIYATGSEEEIHKALLQDADYISLVELASASNGSTELRIIQNFKGSLSNIEFTPPEGLSANKKYLIFYHDSDNGTIEEVDKKYGVYEIPGTDDPFFTQIQKRYAPESFEKKNESATKTSSDAKESDKNTTGDTKKN